ncbi:metallophosphoesterase [Clostridium sp.]|uniref:metallophosphoesterase n=1 Tax=Clostridium sp. TaxID=1506 RepID=UPI001A3BC178|nr:metallophosphoesterase [Clostridium sp.]MBK5242686.1 metallophosphoesterase [Clostridium sp.]
MAYIFAISDIHGFSEPLNEVLSLIDLSSNEGNKLIFCGDYIDYGTDSCNVLYKIKELTETYPNQVTAIMGNHEYMFLEFLNADDRDIWNIEWLGADRDFSTSNTFISSLTREMIGKLKAKLGYHNYLFDVAKLVKKDILNNHIQLVKWLKNLPFYYETDCQILVHAGVDEEAEEYWMHGTPEDYFVSKYPATFGKFYKYIIAGHISTSSLAKDKDFHSVYWDGKSHFFIDGETNVSGIIPLLKYDTVSKKYYSFKKQIDEEETIEWEEYLIK